MNKRSVPIAIISCILVVAGFAGYVAPGSVEGAPARLLMENPGGRIVFTHKAHSTPGGAYGDNNCAVCHHELNISSKRFGEYALSGIAKCTACHGAAENPNFIASHQTYYQSLGGDAACLPCHHVRMGGYAAGWNHGEHKDDYAGGDCETCHHPERYTSPSGKTTTIKKQKCSNCHSAKPNPLASTSLKDAAHAKCSQCHSDLFEEKTKGCATCHTQISLSDDLARGVLDKNFPACASCHEAIPGAIDAFHGQCMGCHDTSGKGPGKEAPCVQCHIP